MSKIIGSLVMRNESARYLESCLRHNLQFCDKIVVYDDCSDDDSVNVAYGLGCTVAVRDTCTPSFAEHEGQFRQAAWDNLGYYARSGDWVFSFDADEFLCATAAGQDAKQLLRKAVSHTDSIELAAVRLPIPEVFSLDSSGTPLVRCDGYWRSITGVRLVKWLPNGRFLDRPMACGSVPVYVDTEGVNRQDCGLALLHYGYLDYEDRIEKYARYSSHLNSGHNPRHIESIMTEPTLGAWTGTTPNLEVVHG